MRNEQQHPQTDGIHEAHLYNLQRAIERFERRYIGNMLVQTRWDHHKAAHMSGIAPETLTAKIHRYHLSPGHIP